MSDSPGLFTYSPPKPEVKPGAVEIGVKNQLDALETAGHLTAEHAGVRALALTAARDVDMSTGVGAPSGRAQLLRTLNEILASLPVAPPAAEQDAFNAALEAITAPKREEEGE